MRIVFMGTPDFARASLAALLDMAAGTARSDCPGEDVSSIVCQARSPGVTVAGVFTQPDRIGGRGMKPLPSPVKALALAHDIPVFQPVKMRDGAALARLREWRPDLIAVVAYGRMLPREILDLPPLGCVNVHASLLPELRGAAPIQWAIARGYEQTGVTTMMMAEECDAGDILYTKSTRIGEREDAPSLHDRLRDMGAALLQETVRAIAAGTAKPVPQDHAKATFAPVLRKEDGVIDLSRPVAELDRLIRAMTPWPGAALDGLKIHRAVVAPYPAASGINSPLPPQFIPCRDGILELLEVQAPGKKRMNAEDYFRGRRGG